MNGGGGGRKIEQYSGRPETAQKRYTKNVDTENKHIDVKPPEAPLRVAPVAPKGK